MSQVLRPTLLAPEIVQAIIDQRQPAGLHGQGVGAIVPVAEAAGRRRDRSGGEGVYATLDDLARAKRVAPSYVRVLRLTLLAPEIVEAILDGRQSAEMQLDDLLAGFPVGWKLQRRRRQHRFDSGVNNSAHCSRTAVQSSRGSARATGTR